MSSGVSVERFGLILLNLGGPDSIQAVRPFLYNLFSDRDIIKLGPRIFQKPLAWLISSLRSKKTVEMYRLIGSRSPLYDITNSQAKALEKALNAEQAKQKLLPFFKVYTGMRYWHPFIEETLRQVHKEGIRTVIGLSLYPQYSVATSGSAAVKFEETARKYQMKYHVVSSWYDHPLYIDALVDTIIKGIKEFKVNSGSKISDSKSDVHVLFSAHSLPMRIIESGDPYAQHIRATIEEITKKLDLRWHLAYQSKSGPVRWLGPSTGEKIKELADKGVKNLLAVPISFVSDHIETLYEIDILYKKLCDDLGIRLVRTQSLNTHPLFIEALKDLVNKGVQDMKQDRTT